MKVLHKNDDVQKPEILQFIVERERETEKDKERGQKKKKN